MDQHPAPWHRQINESTGDWIVRDADGQVVAESCDEVSLAIETLPDLRAAVEQLLSRYGQFGIDVHWLAASKGITA